MATPPHNSRSLYDAALASYEAGNLAEAAVLCERALAADANLPQAWQLLGIVRFRAGAASDGIRCVSRALDLMPQWPAASYNLATMQLAAGQVAEARISVSRGLAVAPQHAPLLFLAGCLLCEQHRCDEALSAFQQVIAQQPQNVEALAGLGQALSALGAAEDSIAAYKQAHALSGDAAFAILAATRLPLVYESREEAAAWRLRMTTNIDALAAAGIQQDLADRAATPVFDLAHQGLNDRELQQTIARLYRAPEAPGDLWQPRTGERMSSLGAGLPIPPSSGADVPIPPNRIRIGFLSSFFRLHSVGKLFRRLLTRLDRSAFEVTLFSVGQHDDVLGRELARSADRYVALAGQLAAARRAILQNSVDVLIFTDIGMDTTTYSLAFSRLAPVQCTTWGHSDTTGLPTIDYFLSGDELETPEADAHYSERLIRLPGLTFSFDQEPLPRERLGREFFGLDSASRLYVCPQSIVKFHPAFDEAIAGILRGDPGGRVVLIEPLYKQLRERLTNRFRRTMPDVVERIHFVRRLEHHEFMNLLLVSDVLLDPFPYGGCVSSLEALAMGLPLVTLPTEFLRGRFTQAFCRRLGLETCIVQDVPQYIETAVRLATDTDLRAFVNSRIEDNRPRLFADDSAIGAWEALLRRLAK
jgi:predicted O-linked N-acetylglucosamine transferase (SPINDLY family)